MSPSAKSKKVESPAPPRRALFVCDDPALGESISELLKKAGLKTVICGDQRAAESVISLEELDLVISGIKIPNGTGIALLHFCKRAKPELPFILVGNSGETLSPDECKDLGARAFLRMPLDKQAVLELALKCLAQAPAPEPAADDQDNEFTKISIDDFVTGRQIKFDLYIRLACDNYVKVAHQGEEPPIEQIRGLRQKNVTHLYLKNEDFLNYVDFNIELSKKLLAAPLICVEKKINFIKHAGEIILERFYLEDLNEGLCGVAKEMVETNVSILMSAMDTSTLLDSLRQYSDSVYAHSVGVSFYSALIARQMKWECSKNLYKVSLGGLLHDIGEKELPKELLGKRRGDMDQKEVHLHRTHTTRGAEILSEIRSVPGDVIQIAAQHHENCLGTGWPAGIKKNYIHPMARVIGLADEFCNLAIGCEGGAPLPLPEVLERICVSRKREFDPLAVDALLKVVSPELENEIRQKDN